MRFVDNQYHDPSRLDFVPRDTRKDFARVASLFGVSILLLVGAIVLDHARGSHFTPILSLIIILLMTFYILVLKQRDMDTVMNTEYLNMLFAQGVALGSSFYLFVRMDGTVAYISDGLRTLFPSSIGAESQPVDRIFEYGGVAMEDRQRLMQAIATCKSDRLVLPIPVKDELKDFVITVEPLPRPAGMLLIRGREFYHRTDTAPAS